MQFKTAKRKRSSINITSLIDVLFILLIFFMVSSSFVEQPGMKLELPATKTSEVARVDNLVLFVSKDSEIFLSDKQVTLDNLADEITATIPNLKEKTLVLKADKHAEHGLIVEIMDIAKRNGLKKIVIGTRVGGEN